jgi:HME family heavy-metal exporter
LLALTWLGVALCILILTRLGADFLPAFDEGSVQINVALQPGASLAASNDKTRIIDDKLKELQKSPTNPKGLILHFVRRSGRAELDEHVMPVGNTEYILSINPESGRSRDQAIRELLDLLKKELPGVDVEAEQPLAHLISHMLSGVTAQIAIKIYGDDLDKLRELAERIKRIIASVPGVTPPVIEAQDNTREVHIRVKPDAMEMYGLSREYVVGFLRNALQGEAVSQVIEGERRFDLIVKLVDSYRTDFQKLKQLRVDLPDKKGQVELGKLVTFDEEAIGPNYVNHDNVRRRMVIRCNTQGRDLAGVVADIEARVKAEIVLPESYAIEYGGQFESQRRATRLIAILALVSIIGMFAVLLMLYPSVRITLQVLNAIPTAFIGGVIALVLTRQSLTVASLVGFISLGGIAVRNGILLVSHYLYLMKHEKEGFTPDMILRGSLERLAPVLMTALTAGIALLPIVIGGQKPGLEILYPVATVIMGGLITSTFCEFLIHPGLFWRFSGKDAEKLTRSGKEAEMLT